MSLHCHGLDSIPRSARYRMVNFTPVPLGLTLHCGKTLIFSLTMLASLTAIWAALKTEANMLYKMTHIFRVSVSSHCSKGEGRGLDLEL